MAISLILAVLLCFTAGGSIYWNRKTCQSIDKLLDCVLSQEKIEWPDLREGELSALAGRIRRIQEVLGRHIQKAEEEKELDSFPQEGIRNYPGNGYYGQRI